MARRKKRDSSIIYTHDGITEVVGQDHFRKPTKLQLRRSKMQEVYRSDHWKEIRRKARKRDGYRCADCGAKDRLEVHHLTYDRLGEELLGDVVTLCQRCHVIADRWRRRHAAQGG